MSNNKPNIIDFEASGFGLGSYPIEVGAILHNGQRYCSLIAPYSDWTYWDPQAEKIHGISRDILMKHGKPIATVANELNEFLLGQTVFSDGWGVDKQWMNELFYKAGIAPMFYLSPLEMVLNEPQMMVWSETKAQVINELKLTRHRASSDALIIQETFVRTRRIVLQKHSATDFTAKPHF